MKDNNVYRKSDNGRYYPIGLGMYDSYLPDGIWYVRHHEYSKQTTALSYLQGLFKVGESKQVDIPVLCGLEDMCDEIMSSQEFKDLMSDKRGYSINDIVHLCVSKMYEKSK